MQKPELGYCTCTVTICYVVVKVTLNLKTDWKAHVPYLMQIEENQALNIVPYIQQFHSRVDTYAHVHTYTSSD